MTDLMTAPLSTPVDDSKIFWKSKTLWAGLVMAVVPFFPPASAFIAANPALFSAAMGGLFAALRVATKGKVSIN